jgi:hypothetical protein
MIHHSSFSIPHSLPPPVTDHGIIIMNDSVGATGSVAHKGNHESSTMRATQRVAPTKTLASGSLGAIIGQFKSKASKRINMVLGKRGVPLWQRGFYEHIVRVGDLFPTITEHMLQLWSHPSRFPVHKTGLVLRGHRTFL